MVLKAGDQLWKQRTKHGRSKAFTPATLLAGAEEYWNWIEKNPLKEERLTQCDGSPSTIDIKKMHAMTIQGLCIFLRISDDTWANYKKHADYKENCEFIGKVIFEQKLSGAAAGLLNANIIARELGLAEKREIESPEGTMSPNKELTDEELEAQIEKRGLKNFIK
jgi:hypothetical protein